MDHDQEMDISPSMNVSPNIEAQNHYDLHVIITLNHLLLLAF